jgi:hypothetical protein
MMGADEIAQAASAVAMGAIALLFGAIIFWLLVAALVKGWRGE